jgi:hypothetical protein
MALKKKVAAPFSVASKKVAAPFSVASTPWKSEREMAIGCLAGLRAQAQFR